MGTLALWGAYVISEIDIKSMFAMSEFDDADVALRGPSLDQLRMFVAVVDTGSFTAAARAVRRVQSAVSHAIAQIEQELGLALFDRAERRPKLTAAGHVVLEEARRVLRDVDRLRSRARLASEALEPEVSWAIDSLFPMSCVVEVCRLFQATFPTVALTVRTEALGGVAETVLSRLCQVGVTHPIGATHEALRATHLATVRMVPVAAPSHPLAAVPPPVPTERLREHVQIVVTDRTERSRGVELGVLATRTWRVADLGTKLSFLREGLGWGNMPTHMIEEDLRAGTLVRLEPEEWQKETEVPLSLVLRHDVALGPAGTWLVEAVRSRV